MIGNITFGQYYPVDSCVHRLDPRFKLISAIALIVAVFCVHSWSGFAIFAVGLCSLIALARIPFGTALRGIKPLWVIMLITFLLNALFFRGETVLWTLGPVVITKEGLLQAVTISVRLLLLIETTTLLMLTTTPMDMTHGIESLLGPLERLRVPVKEIAMMMSIAMRFVPTLIEETDKIMKAQTARGSDFTQGNLFERAAALVPLLVPLFVGAFKRADELALAMEARCYKAGVKRTKLKVLKAGAGDWAALAVTAVLIAAMVFPYGAIM